MTFSDLGRRLAGPCGIQELMEDLGRALALEPDMRMLGGGNPAAVPEMQALWRQRWMELAQDTPELLDRALMNYDPPGGNPAFREAMAGYLRRHLGWEVTAANVVVMPGGQAAFFDLFTLLAGTDGSRQILFPMAPEYIGYANQALHGGVFRSVPGLIEEHGAARFKYRIDFDRVKQALAAPEVAAVCISSPSNPTGNVVETAELGQLREMTRRRGVPLILDQAYGHPFPGAVYVDSPPVWDDGMVVSISLSKLGLPGLRTSMIVASPEITSALANMNAVLALANGNIGQALLLPLLQGDALADLVRDVVRPFYQRKTSQACARLETALAGLPCRVHESQGAFFLWLWLKDCPLPAREIQRRLKQRKVLVVPGHFFFFGLEQPWDHQEQCLRISVGQPDAVVDEGLAILADEVRAAYAG